MSLIQKNYSRATALHHLRNVLQQLDQIAQQLSNQERQKEVRLIWNEIQQKNGPSDAQLIDLNDNIQF